MKSNEQFIATFSITQKNIIGIFIATVTLLSGGNFALNYSTKIQLTEIAIKLDDINKRVIYNTGEIKSHQQKNEAANNARIAEIAKLGANQKQLSEHCGINLFYDVARSINYGAQ